MSSMVGVEWAVARKDGTCGLADSRFLPMGMVCDVKESAGGQ